MDQHVISGFLLRRFARKVAARHVVEVFDKATGDYAPAQTADFLAEHDAHSPEVEDSFELIETHAAAAARSLSKAMRRLSGGIYAVVEAGGETVTGGPAVSHEGVHEGIRLLVSRHQVPSPPAAERAALLRFAALMYQRAPGLEASILEHGRVYDAAAQEALDLLMPGLQTGLATELARYRSRISGRSDNIAARLETASWWLIRPRAPASFVLGDSPVAATVSLGHDDEWRAILATEAYVVVMPLAPDLALAIAPQALMPVTGALDLDGVTAAINCLTWRHAGRFVVGRDREALEAAWPRTATLSSDASPCGRVSTSSR